MEIKLSDKIEVEPRYYISQNEFSSQSTVIEHEIDLSLLINFHLEDVFNEMIP